MGADVVDDLTKWYGIEELISLCDLIVMCRAGFESPDFNKFIDIFGREGIEKLEKNMISTPLIDISSTEIRQKLSQNADVTGMLEPAVFDYIVQNGLYFR